MALIKTGAYTPKAARRKLGLDQIDARMSDDPSTPTAQPKPFGKAMVETYESIKRDYGNKPFMDKNVSEQVNADLDGLIEKNRARKW